MGSNPIFSLSNLNQINLNALVAQMDRASVYGTEGHRFESCRVRFFYLCFRLTDLISICVSVILDLKAFFLI